MEKFLVTGMDGGLKGRVQISGSKNAVLPILAACLLTKEVCEIRNVPPLSDVYHMVELLRGFGAETVFDAEKETVFVRAENISQTEEEYETAGKMRASFLAASMAFSFSLRSCALYSSFCCLIFAVS